MFLGRASEYTCMDRSTQEAILLWFFFPRHTFSIWEFGIIDFCQCWTLLHMIFKKVRHRWLLVVKQMMAYLFKPKARPHEEQSGKKCFLLHIFVNIFLIRFPVNWNGIIRFYFPRFHCPLFLRFEPRDISHFGNKLQDLDLLLLCWVLKNKTKHAYTSNTFCGCNLKLLILI